MIRIIDKLRKLNFPVTEYIALEFFARDGSWQTKSYGKEMNELYLWEIDKKYEHALKKNFPEAKVSIGDSYKISKKEHFREKFNFIVFDNPQGIYAEYCEHFEALPLVTALSKKESFIIFNVNKKPFNYEENLDWKSRRNNYYGIDATNLTSSFILIFYKNLFSSMGFKVLDIFEEKRNKEYLSYLVLRLEKFC